MRLAIVTGLIMPLIVLTVPVRAACDLDPTPCKGCGCKGGPGYREISSQRCVGFRDLQKKCGSPPSSALCVFENAEGTGANRECALAPKTKAPAG